MARVDLSRIFPDYPSFEELLREGGLWLDRHEAHPHLAKALHQKSLFYVISRRHRTLGILWFHDFMEPDEVSVSFVAHHSVRDPSRPVLTDKLPGLFTRSKEEVLRFIENIAFDLLQVERVRAECLVGRQSGKIVAAMGFKLEGLLHNAAQFQGIPHPIACYARYRNKELHDNDLQLSADWEETSGRIAAGGTDGSDEGWSGHPRISISTDGERARELGTSGDFEDGGEGEREIFGGDDRIDPTAERPS